MTAEPNALAVIGVGNEYRGDDGVGVVAARRLRALLPECVSVLEESGEGAALMQAWQDAVWVVIIDAAHSGAPPGTVHRLDARLETAPAGFFHYSTHAFSVAEAIEMARALDRLPAQLIVYGIEGESFAAGFGLSPAVEKAVDAVVERVAGEVRAALPQHGR
jgi:hydrogenase maturation protease